RNVVRQLPPLAGVRGSDAAGGHHCGAAQADAAQVRLQLQQVRSRRAGRTRRTHRQVRGGRGGEASGPGLPGPGAWRHRPGREPEHPYAPSATTVAEMDVPGCGSRPSPRVAAPGCCRWPLSEEGPTIERVHAFIAGQGARLAGKRHEMCMSAIRRAAPSKWRTSLRQPMVMAPDPTGSRRVAEGLERYVEAQEGVFERALGEIRNGLKRGHWIWFVFPQL